MAPAERDADGALEDADLPQLVERALDPPRLLFLRRLESENRPAEIRPPWCSG